MAKPDETLYDHTMSLLECLDEFKIHLTDDEFELLRYCCIYHDIGKMNSFFQERVSSDIKLKFDPTKEMICTLFTGHPVRRVFSCVTVMSIS